MSELDKLIKKVEAEVKNHSAARNAFANLKAHLAEPPKKAPKKEKVKVDRDTPTEDA